jgi:predicted  nucleic acid-binding Zn-ribbon protein
MSNSLIKKIRNWFFENNGSQRKWLVLFSIFIPLIVSALLSFWGIEISKASADNKEQLGILTALMKNSKGQIDTLSNLVKNSQRQIDFLQKIYIATDSTNKSTSNLKELPSKLSQLGQTIDTLNYTLLKETKRLEQSYSSLNKNYDNLIDQQKIYLDKITKVVELTNEQINKLDKNNWLY